MSKEAVAAARERLRQIGRLEPNPGSIHGRSHQYTDALGLVTARAAVSAFQDSNDFMARSLATYFAVLANEPGLLDPPTPSTSASSIRRSATSSYPRC